MASQRRFTVRNSKRSLTPRSRVAGCEPLEPRHLLAADPIISEFSASNEAVLLDGNLEPSDWIEIYNRGDEPAMLDGWHLTDESLLLNKWSFPEGTTVDAGKYLVVFASGSGVPDRAGNLHTNFRLSNGGEYLGLVRPDGATVVSSYSPNYPEQYTDISYGMPMLDSVVNLVDGNSAAQIWVPTSNELSTQWAQTSYVPDGRWITTLPDGQPVKSSLGYEVSSDFGANITTNVESLMKGVNASLYVRIPFQVDAPEDIKDLLFRIKFDDGYLLYLNGSPVDVSNASFFATYNSTALATRDNAAAVEFSDLDLSDYRDKLIAGQNVLGIHLMNVSAGDDDLLLVPELITSGVKVDVTKSGYFSTPTPGSLNPSVFTLGPRVRPATHAPEIPTFTDPVVVTANVKASLNPLGGVALIYRVMYEDEISIPMRDDGLLGDVTANDGVFTGVIPAGAAQPGQMLRYYVQAADSVGSSTRMPAALDKVGTDQSAEYYGTVVADPSFDSSLPIFQWFTASVSRARNRAGTRAS
ncbi:MAG: lamin tail domain-containing protein, partial [Planctomycetales bacterium]|nr:lamin tail domain-containing protein [Planctomycetales bacterium]